MSHPVCNMPHHSAARRAVCHVSLRHVNMYLLRLRRTANAYFCKNCAHTCSEVVVELEPPEVSGLMWTLTSPRGPGSQTRPVLRWCRVCRHIPDCCVCSEPPSSGTPDSSCPAGTCSTTRQPPSHRNLCRLRYTTIRL